MPYRNKNGAEKTFNARLPFASSGRLRQDLRGVSPRHVLSAWRKKQSVRGEAHHHPAKPGDLLQIAQLAFQLVF